MSENIRETLAAATRGEPEVGDAFARFEVVRRKSALARSAVVIAAGALLVALFAFVLPNPLSTGPPSRVPTGGELQPETRDVKVFEDPVAGYQVTYPGAWRVRGTEGETVTFFVDTEPPLGPRDPHTELFRDEFVTEVPKTFYVQVTPLGPGNDPRMTDRDSLEASHDAGALVTQEGVFVDFRGQRETDELRVIYPAKPLGIEPEGITMWCRSCRVEEVTVTLQPRRGVPPLHVKIVAPTKELYDTHRFDAVELIDSIERFIDLARN